MAHPELKISLIVPVRNEENSIRALLDHALRQTRRPDEIVITDGGSTDATPQIIEEYIKRGEPIHLIRETAAWPGRGRNLAAAQASHEWLAFADAGTYPAQDWLETLAEKAKCAPGITVVYGAWSPVTDSFFKECAAIAYAYAPPIDIDGTLMPPPCIGSSLMQRAVWRAVGGFPEHLRAGEDLLFMNKVAAAKFPVAYEPRACIYWEMQPTFWLTFKRFVTYSRHSLRAGLWRQWHVAIFRRYAFLSLCVLCALPFGLRWLILPAALWLVMLGARAVVALRRNHGSYPAHIGRNALRFLLLLPILATLDAATLAGAAIWAVRDKINPAGRLVAGDNQA